MAIAELGPKFSTAPQ
jgi:Phage terminase large subunit